MSVGSGTVGEAVRALSLTYSWIGRHQTACALSLPWYSQHFVETSPCGKNLVKNLKV